MSLRLAAFVIGICVISSSIFPAYHTGGVLIGAILVVVALAYQFMTEFKQIKDLSAVESLRLLVKQNDLTIKEFERRVGFLEQETRRIVTLFRVD